MSRFDSRFADYYPPPGNPLVRASATRLLADLFCSRLKVHSAEYTMATDLRAQ